VTCHIDLLFLLQFKQVFVKLLSLFINIHFTEKCYIVVSTGILH